MNNAGIVVLKREGYCGYKTLKGAYIKEKQVLRFYGCADRALVTRPRAGFSSPPQVFLPKSRICKTM